MKTLPFHAAGCVLLVALFACGGDAPDQAAQTPPPPAEQAPPATQEPSPAGSPVDEGVEAPTATLACANGWVEPTDPEEHELPYHVIRRTMKVDGDFDTIEMRYFEGPESPLSTKGYLQRVDRWYVRAELQGDPSFRGRWLIEERAFGSAVVAVAPFRSHGFVSPDWIGFQYEGEEAPRMRYPGLPGKWSGIPYDFVTGQDPETGEKVFNFPGLPPEVSGCLTGT
jgi:hypothetical protein